MDSMGRLCHCRRAERSYAQTDRFHLKPEPLREDERDACDERDERVRRASGASESSAKKAILLRFFLGATRARVNQCCVYFRVEVRILSNVFERFRNDITS